MLENIAKRLGEGNETKDGSKTDRNEVMVLQAWLLKALRDPVFDKSVPQLPVGCVPLQVKFSIWQLVDQLCSIFLAGIFGGCRQSCGSAKVLLTIMQQDRREEERVQEVLQVRPFPRCWRQILLG
jgi:hypothetical protein